MFNIQKYLEKFSKSVQSAELNKKQILEIIEKNTQISIPPEEIEIKDYIVFVKSSPAVKNKLFIYKNKIIEDIAQVLSLKIIDIR